MGVPENLGRHDERISEDRYGCYTVLFSNVNGLETEDICYIFAEFGQYLSIRKAGNQCGIHFVTYETYEEAKRAVDGLEDHPDIQLKVYRKKRRSYINGGYNNNSHRWPNGGSANDAGQHIRNRWRSANRQFNDHNYAREKYADNRKNGQRHESSACNGKHNSDVDDDEVTKKFVNGNGAGDHCETNELTEDEKSLDYTWLNVKNYLESFNDNTHETDQVESVETIAATINNEHEQFVTSQEDEDSESIEIAEDGKVSVCSTTHEEEEKKEDSITKEIVYAKASEVIVGNVDLRLNEAYLLHLFDKYQPIAVSQLLPLPCRNVGYCYIYFKNDDLAFKVERYFDNLHLHGRKIIVQRPRRLIATYLNQL